MGGTSRWDLAQHKKGSRSSSSSGSGRTRGLRQRIQPLLLLLQLAWRIWPAWIALLMSVGSSMLVFPLFTCVDTSGHMGERLPQVGGTMGARVCPVCVSPGGRGTRAGGAAWTVPEGDNAVGVWQRGRTGKGGSLRSL